MDFLRDRRVDEWEATKRPRQCETIEARVGMIHPPCLAIPRQVASQQSLPPLHQTTANINHLWRSVKKRRQSVQTNDSVASALPWGRGPRLQSQSDFGLGLGSMPSVPMIKTALQRETVAENIQCHALAYGMNDCRLLAAAFTKGWIGVQPQRKERLDNLENKDRDHR